MYTGSIVSSYLRSGNMELLFEKVISLRGDGAFIKFNFVISFFSEIKIRKRFYFF